MQDQKSQYNNESQSYRRKTDSYDNILKREWVTVAREPNKKGLAFTVLNYNILSQQLLESHSYLYQNCGSQALRWNQRFHNLVGEILHNNPDILCCQVGKKRAVKCSLK
jgi:mRNA deadenylase 3'-5' endonuclease subunit Ccr4